MRARAAIYPVFVFCVAILLLFLLLYRDIYRGGVSSSASSLWYDLSEEKVAALQKAAHQAVAAA